MNAKLFAASILILICGVALIRCGTPVSPTQIPPAPSTHERPAADASADAKTKFNAAMAACNKLSGDPAIECVDRAIDELEKAR